MSSVAAETRTGAGRLWYLLITAFTLAFDQFTKYWAATRLKTGDDIDIIPGFFRLSYTENPGIAFGIGSDSDWRWLLIAISTVAIFIVIFYMMRTPASNSLLLWSLALLAAGIGGNLVDRVRTGRVIDFIEFYYGTYHFPVFNIADTAITIGAGLMAIDLFTSTGQEQATAQEPSESLVIEAESKPESGAGASER